jgi:hypothetical protein
MENAPTVSPSIVSDYLVTSRVPHSVLRFTLAPSTFFCPSPQNLLVQSTVRTFMRRDEAIPDHLRSLAGISYRLHEITGQKAQAVADVPRCDLLGSGGSGAADGSLNVVRTTVRSHQIKLNKIIVCRFDRIRM